MQFCVLRIKSNRDKNVIILTVFLELFANMILNINIYTYIYQFQSGTVLFFLNLFLSRLSAWKPCVKLSCHLSCVRDSPIIKSSARSYFSEGNSVSFPEKAKVLISCA